MPHQTILGAEANTFVPKLTVDFFLYIPVDKDEL